MASGMTYNKLTSWDKEVREIRKFLDESYQVTLPSKISVSYDTDYQYGWAKTGLDKFCDRCIPQISNADPVLLRLLSALRTQIYDTQGFGNSTMIVDDAGNFRVSTPESSYAWMDAFGNVEFTEELGDSIHRSINGVLELSEDGGKTWEATGHATFTIFNRADGSHPTGRSRVTPSIRKTIRSASRAKLRAEVASNYRTYPMIVFSGLWEDMATEVKQGISKIKAGISNVVGLPRDPDTGQTVDVKEISAADFTPFLALKDAYARDVAAAFNIEAAELGVGAPAQASAESQHAAKEDLAIEITAFEQSIEHTVKEIIDYVADLHGLTVDRFSWAEPSTASKGAQADAFVKLAAVIPAFKYSAAAMQWAGLPGWLVDELTKEQEELTASYEEPGNESV